MTINKAVAENKRDITISIHDRFDFSLHQMFRDAYVDTTGTGAVFTLDLSQTTYMDSSALGMILLLKDHAEKVSGKVIITNPSASVAKILEIAQFHRLITIES